jgi:predicted amidophosphoribosyltransferase
VDLLSLLAPPLCLCCRTPLERAARGPGLCTRCSAEIEREPGIAFVADGIDSGFAPLAYEGPGRRLVAALKFSRLLVVAELGAALIAADAPDGGGQGAVIVPVPGAPVRSLRRGFDPAWEIAASLAGLTGMDLRPVLRRRDLRHQRGRPRHARISEPPKIEAIGTAPVTALLVDDVVTTGATMTASARALRAAGSVRVDAAALAAVRPRRRRG